MGAVLLLLGSIPWVVTATYSTAAERAECLAKESKVNLISDGGSCDKCCQGITGTCKELMVSGVDDRDWNYIKFDDKDNCVLVEGNYNNIWVTFPRLKLPRLFVHPRVA